MLGLLILFIILVIVVLGNNKSVPVFLYHQVNEESNIIPELFEEHLKILKKNNCKAITLTEFKEKKYNLKDKVVLITLDDGYYDNYKIVYPLLKKYGFKATIFLNTMFLKEKRENEVEIKRNDEANYEAVKEFVDSGVSGTEQYMTWEEIKEMYNSGLVDFQAHSHKHRACFENTNLRGVYKEGRKNSSEYYLYKDVKEGYPIFRKRGEMSIQAVDIDRSFFDEFKKYYEENLKVKDEKNLIKLGQNYIDENIEKYIKRENYKETEERIKSDVLKNRDLIEEHLSNKVYAFCWPWGHKSRLGIEIMKKYDYNTFITTKKGGNLKKNTDFENIKRIELRKFTAFKFRLNLFIAQNSVLAKLYELVS